MLGVITARLNVEARDRLDRSRAIDNDEYEYSRVREAPTRFESLPESGALLNMV